MFRRRREKERAELVQAIVQAVTQAIGERSKPDLAQAGEFGGKMLDGMAKFLDGAGEIALRGAASQLGQRGGKRTQARRRATLAAQEQEQRKPVCKLCRDPLARPLTVAEILNHREHEHNVNAGTDQANDPGDKRDTREIPRNEFGLYAKQRIVGNTDQGTNNSGGSSGLPN